LGAGAAVAVQADEPRADRDAVKGQCFAVAQDASSNTNRPGGEVLRAALLVSLFRKAIILGILPVAGGLTAVGTQYR
jgi:hypothetical protein